MNCWTTQTNFCESEFNVAVHTHTHVKKLKKTLKRKGSMSNHNLSNSNKRWKFRFPTLRLSFNYHTFKTSFKQFHPFEHESTTCSNLQNNPLQTATYLHNMHSRSSNHFPFFYWVIVQLKYEAFTHSPPHWVKMIFKPLFPFWQKLMHSKISKPKKHSKYL